MTAVADGVLVYASDPDPTAGEIVFDFVQGSVVLAVALDAPVTVTGTLARTLDNATSTAAGASGSAGTLAVTLADTTSTAAGTFTDATAPEPPPLVPSMPIPPTGGTGRTVRLTLTADLGTITAQTGLRLELADEELIELL